MSATAELIRDLSARGVRLSPRGDRLRVEAPPGVLTDELRRTLAANKPDLLAALRPKTRVVGRGRVDFRLTGDSSNAWATALAAPGEAVSTVIEELHARHGDALVIGDVREHSTAEAAANEEVEAS